MKIPRRDKSAPDVTEEKNMKTIIDKKSLAWLPLLALAACGSSGTSTPPVLTAPLPGAIVPGAVACIPVQPGAPIPFSAQQIYIDSFNIIGGKIPAIAGLFNAVNQNIGISQVGAAVALPTTGPNILSGSSPDGTITMTIQSTPTQPYAGTMPQQWFQSGGSIPWSNPLTNSDMVNYGGMSNFFMNPMWNGSQYQVSPVQGSLSGQIQLSPLVVQDIRERRGQAMGGQGGPDQQPLCVRSIGFDMGRTMESSSGYMGAPGIAGGRLYGGRVYLWLNDERPNGNYILYF